MMEYAYIAMDQFNKPHILLATFMKSEANDALSKYETMVMLTVMLTRLQSDNCPDHSIIPVSEIFVSASDVVLWKAHLTDSNLDHDYQRLSWS